MKTFLVSLGRALPAAAIMFGLMVYLMVFFVTLLAGLFIHFAIATAIAAYTVGCYLWAFRHDKGFIVRRFKELMQ